AMYSRLLGGAADLADTIGAEKGLEAGQKAVTVGPNGVLQVEHLPLNLGSYGRAYEAAVKVGILAKGGNILSVKNAELRAQYIDNPAGYDQAFKTFKDGVAAQYPSGSVERQAATDQLDQLHAQT